MRVVLLVDFELIVVAFLLTLSSANLLDLCERHLRRHLLQLLRQGVFGPIGL